MLQAMRGKENDQESRCANLLVELPVSCISPPNALADDRKRRIDRLVSNHSPG